MNRLEAMIEYYRNVDTVTTALILFAVWAAGTGHLVDWITSREGGKFINTVYWFIVIILYVLGIVIVGTKFS